MCLFRKGLLAMITNDQSPGDLDICLPQFVKAYLATTKDAAILSSEFISLHCNYKEVKKLCFIGSYQQFCFDQCFLEDFQEYLSRYSSVCKGFSDIVLPHTMEAKKTLFHWDPAAITPISVFWILGRMFVNSWLHVSRHSSVCKSRVFSHTQDLWSKNT